VLNIPDCFKKALADIAWTLIVLCGLKNSGSVFLRKVIFYRHIQRRDLAVSAFPWKVKINTGYKCNLRCPLCATGLRESPSKHDLTAETFGAFLGKLEPVKEIYLFGWGEPFLNKDIFTMIRMAKSRKKRVFIDSNLSFSSDEKLTQMVESGLDFLSVSLDGANQEAYAKYRIGGDFDLVVGNIKKIQQAKKRLRTQKPFIQWQYIVNRHNQGDMEAAAKLARELEVSIKFMPIGLYLDNFNPPDTKAAGEWLPLTMPKILEGQNSAKTPINDSGYCYLLYYFPMIDVDGAVFFCCPCSVANKNNSLVTEEIRTSAGNLNDSGLMDIFNNDIYRHARSLFAKKEKKIDGNIACDVCRMYKTV
jgi:MoaA/NifB/PqqE/SkfB family radical SAM enzyme